MIELLISDLNVQVQEVPSEQGSLCCNVGGPGLRSGQEKEPAVTGCESGGATNVTIADDSMNHHGLSGIYVGCSC